MDWIGLDMCASGERKKNKVTEKSVKPEIFNISFNFLFYIKNNNIYFILYFQIYPLDFGIKYKTFNFFYK